MVEPGRSVRSMRAVVLASAMAIWGGGMVAWGQTFTAPLSGGADPYVMQWQGQYFYTRTTGSDVKLSRAPELQNIINIPGNNLTVWNPPDSAPYGRNIWAPELHRLNGKWYIYVAADDGNDANHRMYVLEGNSQDPQGTYTLKGQISPPSSANRWAIDGTVFSKDGRNYMVWSGRTNGPTSDAGNSQSLYIAEMSNPWTLTGNRVRISLPSMPWEQQGHPVNEGPQILQNGDDIILTYSASGYYTPNYAIGALKLTGSDPLSPSSWTKQSSPLFQQGNGVTGTGHASFVKSPDGTEDWIVYHGRTAATGSDRQLFMQPFGWDPTTGLPAFGSPIAPGTPIPVPSGRPLSTYVANGSFDRPDVTVNSSTGRATTIGSFSTSGSVGVVSNTGRYFDVIAGGDGPQVATLGMTTPSGMWQDIGIGTRGTYTLSAGFAISSDEMIAAALNPGLVRLTLDSVGSSASDFVRLGMFEFETELLQASLFTYFDVSGIVTDARDGTTLRIGITTWDGAVTGAPWSVKVSFVQLGYSATIPEPGGMLSVAGSAGLALRRRRRRVPAMTAKG